MAWYNWSQTAASNSNADSSINWQEGQVPSSINDSARAMMAATAKYRDDVNGSLTTGGTSTAYTLTSNSAYDTLAHMDGQTIAFTVNATSGAAPTLNIDSLGAKPIRNATGVTLPTGALVSGSVYKATYKNTAGEFLIQNQPGVLPTGSVTTTAIAAAAVTYATIQNVAATSLLGNPTGSPASASEITLGAGLAFSGTTLAASIGPTLVPNYLSGLTLSAAGSTGTFGIATGVANDTTNANLMQLASAYTKTTASWAVGTGNGGLDTGAIANTTWYHVWLIKRTDTNIVDVLFSLSATTPTMPASYTLKRRIGAMKTDGSAQWLAFTQAADQFIWSAPVLDVNAATTTASRVNTALTVPTGVVVTAMTRAFLNCSGSTTTLICSLLEADAGVTNGNATFATSGAAVIAGAANALTNTSAQVAVRSGGVLGALSITTYGWIDTRGK